MTNFELVTAVCSVVVAGFAGVALAVGLQQVRISREVSALSAYEAYHLACLQYPKLASGRMDWRECEEDGRTCYCTFVLFALMTGERVLKLFPNDQTWIFAVKDDIRIHRDLIGSDFFKGYRDHQDPLVRKMIYEVLAEPTISDRANPQPPVSPLRA